ncbi:uncharacterized protein LOC132066080 [Lycium ferocissimum]|uniref:uncharacterized protein LOC132066080 n=1 Tax=Lycium ferocissimum TaxID=112874 RepID=UPI002815210B|nr:uncharacterized protein LOC132066080 [Lycium ferocissimum]
MESTGKEHSMPYQVMSRAVKTLVEQYDLDIEALTSSRLAKTLGAKLREVEVVASHVAGHPQSATEATQDKGDAVHSGIVFESFDIPDSLELGQHRPATVATLDIRYIMQLDAFFELFAYAEFGPPLSALQHIGDANPDGLNQTTTEFGLPLSAIQDIGDANPDGLNQTTNIATNIADDKRDSLTLEDDVAGFIPRLELGIGTQNLQRDSANHQVDDVEIDAMDSQRNVVHADLEKQVKTKRIKRDYGITLQVLKQQCGKTLTEAANSLGVARSTLKRICRDYKIYRWPRVKSRKHNCSVSQVELLQAVDRQPSDSGANHQPCVDLSPKRGRPKSVTNSKELAVTMLSENIISVKVTYGNRTVRFPLSSSSGKKDLEEEVEKRMKIVGNYSIRYEDEEKELILITCDADLHYAIHTLTSLGRTIIRMLVEIEPGTTIT